jgi:hypothetical protein
LLGPAASRKATQVSEDQLAWDVTIITRYYSRSLPQPPSQQTRHWPKAGPHALSDGSAHAFHSIPPLAALNATQECDSKGESEKADGQINHVVS